MLLPWKEWAMWQSSMPPVLALHFFCCVCVSKKCGFKKCGLPRQSVPSRKQSFLFNSRHCVSKKHTSSSTPEMGCSVDFFPRNTRVFFYDFCSSSPSSKEFVLSLNKLFQLPGDEMWWMINVVHPIYTKELPHWDGLCHPFLRNAERADGKLGWNHPSRTQMPRSVMMWIWIYHDLFIYLPNCLFMRWFIELFIYISNYLSIYLLTYLVTYLYLISTSIYVSLSISIVASYIYLYLPLYLSLPIPL